MMPASESKMNEAAPDLPFSEICHDDVELNTMPVGAPLGIVTTKPPMLPVPWSYRVDRPVPLSDTQMGLLPDCAMPHGFTRFGSVCAAFPAISESSLVILNAVAPIAGEASSARATARLRSFLIKSSIGLHGGSGLRHIGPAPPRITDGFSEGLFPLTRKFLAAAAADQETAAAISPDFHQYGGVRPV